MKVFQVFIFTSPLIYGSFACDGWTLKNLNVDSCKGDGGLLKLNDISAVLNSSCEVTAFGSVEITQQINDCNISYTLNKEGKSMMPPLKVTGKKTLCATLEDSKQSSEAKAILNSADITKCPIEPKTVNMNGLSVSVIKHKDKLGIMGGKSKGVLKGTCETPNGVVGVCKNFEFELIKAGGKTKMFSG